MLGSSEILAVLILFHNWSMASGILGGPIILCVCVWLSYSEEVGWARIQCPPVKTVKGSWLWWFTSPSVSISLCIPTRSMYANNQRGRKLTLLSFLSFLSSFICFPVLLQQMSNTHIHTHTANVSVLFKGYMTMVIYLKWCWMTLLWCHILFDRHELNSEYSLLILTTAIGLWKTWHSAVKEHNLID